MRLAVLLTAPLLLASTAIASADETVAYACRGLTSPVMIQFQGDANNFATLKYADLVLSLPKVPSKSGTRYAVTDSTTGTEISVSIDGNSAIVTTPRSGTVRCTAKR